ncbi:hypothetical protein P8C59_001591 [Phyllachora maydis]|uniref:alpha-glucosidase n=1 Tax=Phyllachora maydis TaxID=1825666 RepID=A0AAD9HYS2_9PEZI|nr:hypothetical protein P8C59_001591 [Phyllachora maydis]
MLTSSPLSGRWTALLSLLTVLSTLVLPNGAVKEHDFKKCHQSGFCQRNRAYADKALETTAWKAPYLILPETASFKDGQFKAIVLKTINEQGETVRLPLTVTFHESGTARVTMDEEKRQKGQIELRHGSKARKERYNEAEDWVVVGGTAVDAQAEATAQDESQTVVRYGPSATFEAAIQYAPFSVEFRRDGQVQIKLNDRGLLNMEHWRPKVDRAEPEKGEGEENNGTAASKAERQAEDESTWWDESFGGNTDSKPRGPESVALDISFVGFEHVYGIPSHAGPLSLKETRGGEAKYTEPYRMYNADVFEYILDSPMTLYGSIPYMQAHRKDSHVGVFWLNAAETWVDITKGKEAKNRLAIGVSAKTTTQTHWISESGLLDVFVFLGPTVQDLTQKYGELTGYTAMPQEFALGYHQCRWNYVSDEDVKDVDRKMDKYQIPYDVIWLDLEYTEDKKYFRWDKNTFPDPIGMEKQLDSHGRKLVTIVDPHIKNVDGYEVVTELKSKDLAVHDKEGNVFEGWCWPGSSHWVDCFNAEARKWWGTLFQYDRYKGTMENVWIWNDMNEPSVFNGPETTMPKDNLHHGGWEHRDVHNLNGMTFHNATYHALVSRKAGEHRRPFVLTRSFFAGSQRVGAMWTGDNQAAWEHLEASIPMVLSQGIAGFPFAGADVGGFFGNPDRDLQARWYQAGAFYPFFRGHAHIDARRREPYLAGEPQTGIITAALRLRYSLLPAWYTAFRQAHTTGAPIVRPMFWTHPTVEAGFAVDDQLFVGGTGLLAKPVVREGQVTQDIWIPDDEVYYDYFTYRVVAGPGQGGRTVTVPAPLDTMPLLMRGGHVFPRRDIPRRSSALMRWDDYTLVVTMPAAEGVEATGELYVDDGDSFEYRQGQYIHRRFVLDGAREALRSLDAEGPDGKAVKEGAWMKAMREVKVGKVIVVGAPAGWKGKTSVVVETAAAAGGKKGAAAAAAAAAMDFVEAAEGRAAYAVVRGLGVRIGEDWKVVF